MTILKWLQFLCTVIGICPRTKIFFNGYDGDGEPDMILEYRGDTLLLHVDYFPSIPYPAKNVNWHVTTHQRDYYDYGDFVEKQDFDRQMIQPILDFLP